MSKLQQFFFSKARQSPAIQDERARMCMFMELHAKCVHAEKHLHHEKRHMEKRKKILSSLDDSGDMRSVRVQGRIAIKKKEILEIKEKLHSMQEEMRSLAGKIESTETYKQALKKAERTYKIVDWIERNNADGRLFTISAIWTVASIAITEVNHAWELFLRAPFLLLVSTIAARFIIDDRLGLAQLKEKADFLKNLSSFAAEKEHLKKEAHQTLKYA